jgi:predicted ATPase
MGVVFEALDRERNMRVALKLLPEIEPVALYLFKHEFRALAELSHPNLIPLYELISDGDRWFFTMEFLDDADDFFLGCQSRIPLQSDSGPGRDSSDQYNSLGSLFGAATAGTASHPFSQVSRAVLAPSIRTPALELDYQKVRAVFVQIAVGVCALHRAGKLHRDLKPGNVFVRRDGRVVLLDFGLVADLKAEQVRLASGVAPAIGKHATVTSWGFVKGTLTYMSPEQVRDEPLTPASDWYAVGVMLYEVLTGHVPFHDKEEHFVMFKKWGTPPSPSEVRPGTPEDLNRLCMALLNREPAARPTGEQVLAVLLPDADATGATVDEVIPFVGRQQDLQRLDACWERMRQGSVVTLHVHGPSGAGKSSLVRHFLDGLTRPGGPVIVCGRCYEQESVPFKALDSVVDALTRYLFALPELEAAGLLPEQTGALARVFPVLRRVPGVAARVDAEGPGSIDLREVQAQAFMALRELFSRIGQARGLVVWVDDLQWGDADSAALLNHLMKPPDVPLMLLVLTYRTEYIGQSACLGALDGAENVAPMQGRHRETLELQPLNAADTLLLAQELLGDGKNEHAEWVVRESRGAAFFVYELARYAKSGAQFPLGERVNLDAVLWQRVSRLPADSLRLLELVAVAGEPLPLRAIQDAGSLGALPPQVITHLRAAHLVRTAGPGINDEIEFFHDRVRESVREHIAPAARQAYHGALADTLQASGAGAEKLAPHYEGAGRLDEAARCYVLAADEAVTALAFNRAEEFFRKAASLTPEPLARAQVQERMIHFYTDTARFADAYQVAREAAQALGIVLPPKFVPPLLIRDFLLSKWRMRGMRPADVLKRATMTDPRLITAVRLINAGAKAAYQVRPELCIAVSTLGVNLCLRHGITPDCAVCWMVYGAIFQGGILGRHRLGYDFGQLALGLVEKFRNDRQRAEVNFVVGYFGTSWVRPAREAEQLWKTAWRSGLETGDLFHTGCAGAGLVLSQFMRGVPFGEVLAEADRILPTLERAGLREPVGVIHAVRQAIRNLRGQTHSPETFSDDDFDEEQHHTNLATYGSRHFAHIYFIVKMKVLCLRGLHDPASRFAHTSAGYLKESPGMLHSSEHHFYFGLNCAALAAGSSLANSQLTRKVRAAHRRFRKWAPECPENFLARERLLAAEVARLSGRTADALAACEEARQAAATFGNPHLQALADRLASRLHHAAGSRAAADHAAASAASHFRRWGAVLETDSPGPQLSAAS